MNPVTEYLRRRKGISAQAKWVLHCKIDSGKRMHTEDDIAELSGEEYTDLALDELVEAKVLGVRELNGKTYYFITDTRLLHRVAAESQGKEPIA